LRVESEEEEGAFLSLNYQLSTLNKKGRLNVQAAFVMMNNRL
jgi:hypothetical protein